MLDKIVPLKFIYLFDLIRLNKPIGFMLLMWPCWFSLAIINQDQFYLIEWYLYFLFGSFLMRSAGCIINDLIDIKIDRKVKRTANRPLASKKISISESFIFLFVLLLLAFFILIQFNFNTILIGMLSLPLVIIYPFMKRFTNWPQLFLGIIFNWGILIVSVQFFNLINLDYIILYIACIFWTFGYETIYAYQDREDDLINGIKSTAVLFNKNGKKLVVLFYTIFLFLLGYLGYKSSGEVISLIIMLFFIFVMILCLNKWKTDSRQSSNKYFILNNYVGLFCFIYLIIF